VNTEEEPNRRAIEPPRDGPPLEEQSPCVEYLQRAIARLLMRNETMRFELLALHHRIAHIEQTLFGAGSEPLRKRLPPHLLGALRDLCRCQTSGPAADMEPASDNLNGFRNMGPNHAPDASD